MSQVEDTISAEELIQAPGRLLSLLQGAQADPLDLEISERLEDELTEALPWLHAPLSLPPPEAAQRTKIESQAGVQYAPARIEECKFLSDYLHVSEDLAVVILEEAARQAPKYGRTTIDTAIKLFHELVRARIECLKAVFRGIEPQWNEVTGERMNSADFSETEELLARAADILYQRSNAGQGGQGGRGMAGAGGNDSFFDSVFKQIETCAAWIEETIPGDRRLPLATQLPADVQALRVGECRSHQRGLIKLLYTVAANGNLRKSDLIGLVKWLKTRTDIDGLTILGLSVFLAAIQHYDPSRPLHDQYEAYSPVVKGYAQDPAILQIITNQIIASAKQVYEEEWKQPWISRILLLSWCLFVEKAWLSDRYNDHMQLPKILEKGVDTVIQASIEGDAFQNLRTIVLPTTAIPDGIWRHKHNNHTGDHTITHLAMDPWPEIEQEYAADVLRQVDLIIKSLLGAFSHINKLRNREEDRVKSSDAAGNSGEKGMSASGAAAGEEISDPSEVRTDFVALVELIIALYRELPLDHDDTLWTELRFFTLVADMEGLQGVILLSRLTLAVSSGRRGTDKLYQALVDSDLGKLDFDEIFGHFQHVVSRKPMLTMIHTSPRTLGGPGSPQHHLSDAELRPEEAQALEGYCAILIAIFRWHPTYAHAMLESHDPSPVSLLWQLVNRNIPTTTKAAVLDTINAFCAASGEVNPRALETSFAELEKLGVRSAKEKHPAHLESMTQLPSLPTFQDTSRVWLFILETNDVQSNTSVATSALTRLFRTLLDDRATTPAGHDQSSSISALKLSMVRYIMDDATPRATTLLQHATTAGSGYSLLSAILAFFQRSLLRCDFSSIIAAKESSPGHIANPGELGRLTEALAQPGVLVLHRLLSDDKLRNILMEAAVARASETAKNDGSLAEALTDISLHALQVIQKALQAQSIFLEVLLPSLRAHVGKLPQYKNLLSASFSPLDWFLAHQAHFNVQIATYVGTEMPRTLAQAAISLLGELGRSPHMASTYLHNGKRTSGNALAYMISSASESMVILAGFVDRLSTEDVEQESQNRALQPARLWLDSKDQITLSLNPLSTRDIILGFLLEGIQLKVSGLTLAHFLLGYLSHSPDGSPQIARHLPPDGIHAAIDRNNSPESSTNVVHRTCFHVIVDALSVGFQSLDDLDRAVDEHPLIIAPAFAYKAIKLLHQLARNELTALPTTRYLRDQKDFINASLLHLPLVPQSPIGSEVDGTLLYEDGVTTKLPARTLLAYLRYQAELFSLAALELHITSADSREAERIVKAFIENSESQSTQSGQSGILGLEALQRLNLQWLAELSTQPNAQHFVNVDFASYQTVDQEGCVIYDLDELDIALRRETRNAVRNLVGESALRAQHALDLDRRAILKYLDNDNRKAQIALALNACLEAWSKAIAIIVGKTAHFISEAHRASIINELSLASFETLGGSVSIPAKTDILSNTILALATSLQTEQQHPASRMPEEQLQTLLRHVISGVVGADTTESARGFLYSTMIIYLRCLLEFGTSVDPTHASLSLPSQNVLQSDIDRLLSVLCRDALNGSEIWKTVSYSLIDVILQSSANSINKLVEKLWHSGVLHNFVASIAENDRDVQLALGPEPGDVNAIFVLEAKLAMMLRIAQTEIGGERLVQAGILKTLATCDFISRQPYLEDMNQSDYLLPMPAERYHQVILPVLQVAAAVSRTLNTETVKDCVTFLTGQVDAFLPVLRSDNGAVSLASTKEAALLVNILYQILRSRESATATLSDLKGYEHHLKALCYKYFSPDRWMSSVIPLTEQEQEQAKSKFGINGVTVFEWQLRRTGTSLLQALLAYFHLATKGSDPDQFKPVFIAGGQLGLDKNATKGGATYASLDQAIQLIDDLVKISPTPDKENLSLDRRRLVAFEEIKRLQNSCTIYGRVLLQNLEALLLLLNRHMRYYNRLVMDQVSNSRRYIQTAKSQFVRVEKDIVLRWSEETESALFSLKPVLEFLRDLPISPSILEERMSRQQYLLALIHALDAFEPYQRLV
ncbi:hypothetical protein QFC22_000773 [Naganishia vaughanmartiniae]|uniref:Uncharacterized protein n=1 Tax=Naganishia vaughanmartiniae TaxID=1424756 RepID=A0ACC2XJ41_9TREE|nr:hypothetical protein QFC22_000773 [Naganishia vaughanmartiniae]